MFKDLPEGQTGSCHLCNEAQKEIERLKNLTHFGYSEVPELKKKIEAMTVENESLMAENERLKAWFNELKTAPSLMGDYYRLEKAYKVLESRLAEAVRVLDKIRCARRLDSTWILQGGVGSLREELEAFLNSPTTSKALDIAAAKDALISCVEENFAGINLPSQNSIDGKHC